MLACRPGHSKLAPSILKSSSSFCHSSPTTPFSLLLTPQVGCELAGFAQGVALAMPASVKADRCSFACTEGVVRFVVDEAEEAGFIDRVGLASCSITNGHIAGLPACHSGSVIRNTVETAQQALGRESVAPLLQHTAVHVAAAEVEVSVASGESAGTGAAGEKEAHASRGASGCGGSNAERAQQEQEQASGAEAR